MPLGMSANALAQAIGVPANRVSGIVKGKRGVTADTALRLARAFGTSPEFWLNLQQSHDLVIALAALGKAVSAIRPVIQDPQARTSTLRASRRRVGPGARANA